MLPVHSVLEDLRDALRDYPVVILTAPPGSGKSTVVPKALLFGSDSNSSAFQGNILLLQPRRLAALKIADYIASTLHEKVGETVGVRMRGQTSVSSRTRIEVMTEGVLTKSIQSDPTLDGVDLIIFDEFHERSLFTDLGFALALDIQRSIRPDLRILLMSATLDAAALPEWLADVPHIKAEGTLFPVETSYQPCPVGGDLWRHTARVVREAALSQAGGTLVFLPGAWEIGRVSDELAATKLPSTVKIFPLLGSLSLPDQRRALEPGAVNEAKVVLATSVAETSITVEGITTVVDCGLERRSAFDPARGLPSLKTGAASKASVDQRRGRAGRLAPGRCIRLWRASDDVTRPRQTDPEIVRADLSYLVLQLAAWGVRNPDNLTFVTPPPPPSYRSAEDLLRTVGALDSDGLLTAHGRAMAEISAHPRIAHMLLWAKNKELLSFACVFAALLEERGGRSVSDDVSSQVQHLLRQASSGTGGNVGVLSAAHHYYESIVAPEGSGGGGQRGRMQFPTGDLHQIIGRLALQAFPDRVGRKREGGRGYLLSNGSGAELKKGSALGEPEWLVVVALDAQSANSRILVGAPVEEQFVLADLGDRFQDDLREHWNERQGRLEITRVKSIGAIRVSEQRVSNLPAGGAAFRAAARLMEEIVRSELKLLPWDGSCNSLVNRSEWLRGQTWAPDDWPDLSLPELSNSAEEWLAPFIQAKTVLSDITSRQLLDALLFRLGHGRLRELDLLVPSTLALPSGRSATVLYQLGHQPVIAGRLQEFFGCDSSPLIGNGRVPVVIELLSPAGRPLQVTSDLRSFWENSYTQVRKEMRGRYPKHSWPENPLEQSPVSSVRRSR